MPRLVRERKGETNGAGETHFHHSIVKHIARKDYHNNTFIYVLVVYHDLYVATYNIARFPTENSVTDSETM